MHRLFVAIRPPEPIRDLLVDAMDGGADFRWQDDSQLHLTLRFVGEVERPVAEVLAAALGRVRAPPFEVRIKGVGRFDQRSSGALWAGVEPKEPIAALTRRSSAPAKASAWSPSAAPSIRTSRWRAGKAGAAARPRSSSPAAAP